MTGEQKLLQLHEEGKKGVPKVREDDKSTWMTPQRIEWTEKHDALIREWLFEEYKGQITQENPFPWSKSAFMSQDIFFAGHWDLLPTAVVKRYLDYPERACSPPRGAIKTGEDSMMYLYCKDTSWLNKMREKWANLHGL